MIDYEKMGVDDLILELVNELLPKRVSAIGTKTKRYKEIEAALRRAVIREEQRGEILFTIDAHGNPIAVGATEIKEGSYLLVSKNI